MIPALLVPQTADAVHTSLALKQGRNTTPSLGLQTIGENMFSLGIVMIGRLELNIFSRSFLTIIQMPMVTGIYKR